MQSTSNSSSTAVSTLFRIAIFVSISLVAARIALSEVVGFGDAEALYVSYGLFGQATYLDHPGLIGWIASLLAGPNGVAEPVTVHRVTSLVATLVPWLGGVAAKCAGASNKGALATVVSIAIVPEIAIGLFAFTPDLPLAVAWIGALAMAALAIRSAPGSSMCLGATLGAGLCVGVACASKASGVLLAAALLATWLSASMRDRWRTIAPYASMLVGAVVTYPMVHREVLLGWPMLSHRLLHTQAGFGPSLRNLGGLIGGQLVYLTPLVAIAVVIIAIDLCRRASDDPVDRLLFNATVPPFVALAVLTVLSRVAEPHWVAPAYLGLALYLGRAVDRIRISRRMVIATISTSLAAIAIVFVVVRYPVLPKILGGYYEARYDLVNDLYVWESGAQLIRGQVSTFENGGNEEVTIVGPHWVVCAQVQVLLGKSVRVGCETPEGDDFQGVNPRERWSRDGVLLYVTDDRFPVELSSKFPDRAVVGVSKTSVRRGGVAVRNIKVSTLTRHASARIE